MNGVSSDITFQNQNKIEEAIECYNKAVVLKPNFAEAFNNLANLLKELRRFEEAEKNYNQAIKFKPKQLITVLANKPNIDVAIDKSARVILDSAPIPSIIPPNTMAQIIK